MRRDLTASQDRETENLREKLRQCKWEYDHLRVENNKKEKQLLELAGGLVRYLGVSEAAVVTGTSSTFSNTIYVVLTYPSNVRLNTSSSSPPPPPPPPPPLSQTF